MTIDFRSDNTHSASPQILEAIALSSAGAMTSYGEDPITGRLRERCRELFETDVEIFPVVTGTAGNALTIASMTPPWGAVFCHEEAHIHRDELGAPEFFSGGAKLIPIAGAPSTSPVRTNGRLDAAVLAHAIEEICGEGRTATPSCVSITQATEGGTVYTVDELRVLCEVAHRAGCRVHMDGARFANAAAHLGVSPADLTWRAGVDALVFGATKNGALAAELIVAFDCGLAREIAPRWHRSGHRLSKMRFLSAQLEAYLTGDLWLRNARHANALAQRLSAGLDDVLRPVEANIVFVRFAPEVAAFLRERGLLFYEWPLFGPDAYRFVVAFDTSERDVDELRSAAAAASALIRGKAVAQPPRS